MTKEEAYRYIDNLKWLKGYDNTTIGRKTVGEILDEIKDMLKEQETERDKWIQCSDGMPEEQESIFAKFKGTNKWVPAMFSQSSEDVRVVIVFEDGTRKVSHSRTIDRKWECEKNPLKRTVTHWMPNPKLPKEGL